MTSFPGAKSGGTVAEAKHGELDMPDALTEDKLKTTYNFIPLHKESKGSFGTVGRVIVHIDGAVKIINKQRFHLNLINNEIKILYFIRQQQVISTGGSQFCLEFTGWWDGSESWCGLGNYICILTKQYKIDLIDELMKLTNAQIKNLIPKLMQQLCSGLHFLHENNIVHLDLKFENMMFDYDNNLRIIDFGGARYIPQGKLLTKERIGTFGNQSPEMFLRKISTEQKQQLDLKDQDITTKADIFTVGLLLYQLLQPTNIPFFNISLENTKWEYVYGIQGKSPFINKVQNIDPPYKTILEHCLQVDIRQRCNVAFIQMNLPAKTPAETPVETPVESAAKRQKKEYHLRF